jgi:Family of unknown function (DUF6534)
MQLSRARSKNRFNKIETVITKLIVYTVQTAAVTAVASLSGLILYTTMPNNLVSIAAGYMIAKLYNSITFDMKLHLEYSHAFRNHRYSNVLLANLNGRLSLSGGTSLEMGPHL